MKSKQLLLAAVLLGVLLVAWVAALGAATDEDLIAEQNALVASADVYAEKDLYIRAIPKYKEALAIATEQNGTIEEKLMAVYLEYGDYDAYIALVKARMDRGAAAESEYVNVARLYESRGSVENAMATAKEGLARYADSTDCKAIYESHRYAYSIRFTAFDEIDATSTGDNFPAKDASGMTMLSGKGKSLMGDARYAYLSRYNKSGYTVVQTEGSYVVLNKAGDRFSIDEVGLSSVRGITASHIIGEKDGKYALYNADFLIRSDTFDELTLSSGGYLFARSGEKWGVLQENNAKSSPDAEGSIAAFRFDEVALNALDEPFAGGLAAVRYGERWYFVNTAGGNAVPGSFAGARAPEDAKGYLAVANDEGLWGFVDRAGNVVIDYQYDDARSFSQNVAAVKRGSDWFYISVDNTPVIESVFYEAGAFHGGAAIAKTPNGTAILRLEYPNA